MSWQPPFCILVCVGSHGGRWLQAHNASPVCILHATILPPPNCAPIVQLQPGHGPWGKGDPRNHGRALMYPRCCSPPCSDSFSTQSGWRAYLRCQYLSGARGLRVLAVHSGGTARLLAVRRQLSPCGRRQSIAYEGRCLIFACLSCGVINGCTSISTPYLTSQV